MQVNNNPGNYGKRQLKGLGKNSERLGDYYSAIDYYSQFLEKDSTDYQIRLRLANLYLQIRDYRKAETQFLRIYKKDRDKYAESVYYAALMEINQGKYDSALVNLDRFKTILKKKKLLRAAYKNIIENHISGCMNAMKILDAPADMNVVHLDTSINKAHIEFSPFPADEGSFIYASLKTDKIVYFDPVDSSGSAPLRKLYIAKKSGNTWKTTGLMEGPFNTENMNTGNGCFSPDGDRFYFTRCSQNLRNKTICRIFLSRKNGTGWSEPEPLNKEINMPDYTSTQPTVGIDSKMSREVLYFVSNRPGGRGGADIWYSIYDQRKKIFKKPKNSGNSINTAENEASPFYDNETHALFFSSSGWPGLGGYDVFKSTGELSSWTNPENFGAPVNSSADDLYYAHFPDREEGFFTSNRKGSIALKHETCCDDIYYFKYNKYIHLTAKGTVFGIEDSSALSDMKTNFEIMDDSKRGISYLNMNKKQYPLLNKAVVRLYVVDKNNNQEILIGVDTTNTKGEYTFPLETRKDYKIIVKNYGNFDKTVNLSTHDMMDSDTIKIKPVGINVMPKKSIKLHNITYEVDKSVLTGNAMTTIDTTLLIYLKEHSDIVVEISSHTDNVGSDKYNQVLSEKRAESVVNYLMKKGIEKSRLHAKGYGEMIPVADNETPEGREKNRRTEFRIIGSVSETKEKEDDI